jgi:hypothetical protein
MTFRGCFLPSFDSFGQAVSEKKIFLEINSQAILVSDWLISKKIFPSVATWPNDWLISKTMSPLKSHGQMNRNLNLYRRPAIDAYY